MNWPALILFAIGSSLVIYGLTQVWTPLAWITGGFIALRIAFVADERTSE